MADTKQATFNLVDERWVKVRTLAEETDELSLRELFHRAHEIRELSNDLPPQDFAILRLCLAVLQRAVIGGIEVEVEDDDEECPADAWGSLWEAPSLPLEDIDAYLDAWHHRFDLFDEAHPFMQVAGLHTSKNEVSDIKKVLMDVPDGLPLFSLRSGAALDSMSYAEAARWLVHLQAFDVSGIKSGVVGDPATKNGKSYPIGTGWCGGLGGVYAQGANLKDTLLLNLCLCVDCSFSREEYLSADDLPTWEQTPKTPGDDKREPRGYADLYTWQSRRVLLFESGGRVCGVVLSNGDKLEAQNRRAMEPMSAWRRSAPQEKKLKRSPVYLPWQHRSNRAMWRGLDALLPSADMARDDELISPGIVQWVGYLASANIESGRKLDASYPIRLRAIGYAYGTQNAVATDMIDDELSFESLLLADEGSAAVEVARTCMRKTEEAVAALARLAARLGLAAGLDPMLVGGARDSAKAEAYYELDGRFRTWLLNIDFASLATSEAQWYEDARGVLTSIARMLVESADSAAIKGRKAKVAGREEWVSAGKAEAQFRYALNKIFAVENGQEQRGEVEKSDV